MRFPKASLPAERPSIFERRASALHRVRWLLLPHTARTLGAPAQALISPPLFGWRVAVRQSQTAEFTGVAASRGLRFDDYITEVVGRLDAWAALTRVRIRMDSDDVGKFLRDGRYRNQFETGTSRGAYTPGRRMLVEAVAFGVPPDVSARYRPTYGYCTGSLEGHPNVIKYGDAVLCLKPDVNYRTTFTFGDSLDEIAVGSQLPPFAPRPLTSCGTLALDARIDPLACNAMWEWSRCGYIESQTYGDVTPADVETIVFTQNTIPTDDIDHALSNAGIQWRNVGGDVP
jgi:hypothetical protein